MLLAARRSHPEAEPRSTDMARRATGSLGALLAGRSGTWQVRLRMASDPLPGCIRGSRRLGSGLPSQGIIAAIGRHPIGRRVAAPPREQFSVRGTCGVADR